MPRDPIIAKKATVIKTTSFKANIYRDIHRGEPYYIKDGRRHYVSYGTRGRFYD